jgi:hypothetical protein
VNKVSEGLCVWRCRGDFDDDDDEDDDDEVLGIKSVLKDSAVE